MLTRHIQFEIADYFDGKLDEAARHRVEEHLNVCERCREDLEIISSALSNIKTLPADSAPPAYFESFLPRLRKNIDGKHGKKRTWNPKLVPAAASALALAVFVFVFLQISAPGRQSGLKDSFKPLIAGLSVDEMAEVMGSQLHGEILFEAENPAAYNTVYKRQFDAENVVKDAIGEKIITPSLTENDYQGVIESLNEEQVDRFILRLKERTIL